MKNLALAIALFIPGAAFAQKTTSSKYKSSLRLFDPNFVSIDTFEYDDLRDPYLAPNDQYIKRGANFNVDLDVIRYKKFQIYWENDLFFDQEGTTGLVRHGGWHYKVGAPVFYWDELKIEVWREHMSRHIMDRVRDVPFPVYDRNGVSIIMIDRRQ